MGVMVCGDGVQCFFRGLLDPLRRSKVHVSLAKVDTVRWKIGSTLRKINEVTRASETFEWANSLEDRPDILSERSPFAKPGREGDEVRAVLAVGDDAVGGHDMDTVEDE